MRLKEWQQRMIEIKYVEDEPQDEYTRGFKAGVEKLSTVAITALAQYMFETAPSEGCTKAEREEAIKRCQIICECSKAICNAEKEIIEK